MDTALSISSVAKDIAARINDFSQQLGAGSKLFEEVLAQVSNLQQSKAAGPTSSASPVANTDGSQPATTQATDTVMQLLVSNQISSATTNKQSTSSTATQTEAVNRTAVAAALNDPGIASNGLKIYQADPTSNAWRSENITDPTLRRYLETLPLSRESTLQILSADDPLAEIGKVYKTMGTYATVENAGDQGGKSFSIRDSEGRVLDSQYWMPDNRGAQEWTSQDANSLQSRLKAYGITPSAGVNFLDIQSVTQNLKQTAPTEAFSLSPGAHYERYGFKTDPLSKEVVGGGSTSAIDYYQSTGKLPPASAVWAAAKN